MVLTICAVVRVSSSRSAPVRSAPIRKALVKVTPENLAFVRVALSRED
ncbi:MAG TPA: hypothetical protein VIP70_02215 [Nitrososphaeraceae archaeon]